MQPSNKIAENEPKPVHGGELPLDPFAVDFFGVRPQPAEEPAEEKSADRGVRPVFRPKSIWHRSLPRVTARAAEFSARLENLPENLTERAAEIIREAIARFTFREVRDVDCALISISEGSLGEGLERSAKSPQIFLTVGCQPENYPAVLALNTEFASGVIDLILGGQGTELTHSRGLSPIEQSIVEFLAVSILSEIDRALGEPLLRLQSVGAESAHAFAPDERGGELVFVIETENLSGMLTVFAPGPFLAALDRRQNPLLAKKEARRPLAEWERRLPRLDLRVQVGATRLGADSLMFLEPDDIVLIDQPEISLERGLLGDGLQVAVGAGRAFRLAGAAENSEFGGELNFRIKEIISEETRRPLTPVKFSMDLEQNELETAAGETSAAPTDETADESAEETLAASLENVQVALRVEIAGNKISLRELQNLRAGQILALGCRPTDPVRLVTDQTEEPVATGELVEIEGQLGVRLTKVFI